jgi:hypothetical protein
MKGILKKKTGTATGKGKLKKKQNSGKQRGNRYA